MEIWRAKKKKKKKLWVAQQELRKCQQHDNTADTDHFPSVGVGGVGIGSYFSHMHGCMVGACDKWIYN